jgi:hypothetical protein
MAELFWKMAEHYRKMADKISRMVEKWLSIVAIKNAWAYQQGMVEFSVQKNSDKITKWLRWL